MSVYRFIAAEKACHPISLMCTVLGVSRSGFHAWEQRPPSDRDLADAWLSERIVEIHRESRGTYGARRIHAALAHRGVHVGRSTRYACAEFLALHKSVAPARFARVRCRLRTGWLCSPMRRAVRRGR